MWKQILGTSKWVLATIASITGTVATDNPLLEAFGTIISTILTANTVVVAIPNKYWEPLLVWLGAFISKFGNKKFPNYEKWEDAFQSGSLRAFITFAVKCLDKGMNKDDKK